MFYCFGLLENLKNKCEYIEKIIIQILYESYLPFFERFRKQENDMIIAVNKSIHLYFAKAILDIILPVALKVKFWYSEDLHKNPI